MECCNTLQYLEGAAYIAIVLAVLGVPELLNYYFERRDRLRERAEDQAAADRQRETERASAERRRQEERADAERRHLEMMTALIAITERSGRPEPAPDPSGVITQIQQRVANLENNVQELQQQRNGHDSAA